MEAEAGGARGWGARDDHWGAGIIWQLLRTGTGLEEKGSRGKRAGAGLYLVNGLEEDDGYCEEGGEAALDVAVDLGEVTEVQHTDGEELQVDGPLRAVGLPGGGARGEVRQVCLGETEMEEEREAAHSLISDEGKEAWFTVFVVVTCRVFM